VLNWVVFQLFSLAKLESSGGTDLSAVEVLLAVVFVVMLVAERTLFCGLGARLLPFGVTAVGLT